MASQPSVRLLQRLTAGLIGVPPWQGMVLAGPGIFALSPFTNVGGGFVAAQYRVWKLINEVEVIGTVSSGLTPNSTFIAPGRLPIPATAQQIPIVAEGQSAAPVQTPYLLIDQFGTPWFKNCPFGAGGTTKMSFHGWYSLDA